MELTVPIYNHNVCTVVSWFLTLRFLEGSYRGFEGILPPYLCYLKNFQRDTLQAYCLHLEVTLRTFEATLYCRQ
jgi:hypothetical protein